MAFGLGSTLTKNVATVVAACVLVGSIALARKKPVASGLELDSSKLRTSRPEAPRPARTTRLDLGVPSTRSAVLAGFGPDEVVDGRSVIRMSERGSLALRVAPDPVAMTLGFIARTSRNDAERLAVEINRTAAGEIELSPDWCLRTVIVPASVFVAGRNVIQLSSLTDSAGLVLDRIWLDSESARSATDIGTASARPRLSGFEADSKFGGRTVARPLSSGGRVNLDMLPLESDYVLAVLAGSATAKSSLSIFMNRNGLGNIGAGPSLEPRFVPVRRSLLYPGHNTLELVPVAGARVMLDSVSLLPLEPALVLDLGSSDVRPHLAAGFNEDETCAPGNCVWSEGPSSKLVFWLRPVSRTYTLSIRAHALAPLAPLAVGVHLNQHSLGTVTLRAGFETVDLPIPVATLANGENVLEFSYPATRQPRSFDKHSGDARELAVSFDWLDIEPEG
jgi:hypothetical protein